MRPSSNSVGGTSYRSASYSLPGWKIENLPRWTVQWVSFLFPSPIGNCLCIAPSYFDHAAPPMQSS